MSRPRRFRKVWAEPYTNYFIPAEVDPDTINEVILTVDEYEAVRLKDLLQMDQNIAAQQMGISQPTFHRLLLSARKKIADSIVHGKALRIYGGPYKMIGQIHDGHRGPPIACICPNCGYQITKVRRKPCASIRCPKCNTPMFRK